MHFPTWKIPNSDNMNCPNRGGACISHAAHIFRPQSPFVPQPMCRAQPITYVVNGPVCLVPALSTAHSWKAGEMFWKWWRGVTATQVSLSVWTTAVMPTGALKWARTSAKQAHEAILAAALVQRGIKEHALFNVFCNINSNLKMSEEFLIGQLELLLLHWSFTQVTARANWPKCHAQKLWRLHKQQTSSDTLWRDWVWWKGWAGAYRCFKFQSNPHMPMWIRK